LSFGSTGPLSHEPTPLHPDPPNHALTPIVAKSNPYSLHVHQANAFEAIKHFLDAEATFIMAGDPAVIPFSGT
jgi:hypothetical protein